eukprot:1065896-Rhodomonas_salina.1
MSLAPSLPPSCLRRALSQFRTWRIGVHREIAAYAITGHDRREISIRCVSTGHDRREIAAYAMSVPDMADESVGRYLSVLPESVVERRVQVRAFNLVAAQPISVPDIA